MASQDAVIIAGANLSFMFVKDARQKRFTRTRETF
jgi:hypothetical protein